MLFIQMLRMSLPLPTFYITVNAVGNDFILYIGVICFAVVTISPSIACQPQLDDSHIVYLGNTGMAFLVSGPTVVRNFLAKQSIPCKAVHS